MIFINNKYIYNNFKHKKKKKIANLYDWKLPVPGTLALWLHPPSIQVSTTHLFR